MALKRGDTGPEVKRLQQALLYLGYALPRWGADGNLGTESLDAASNMLVSHGRTTDPSYNIIDDSELAFIYSVEEMHKSDVSSVPPPTQLIDRRSFAGNNKDYGAREWTNVTGWCLHQTACNLSSSKDIARCDKVGAHFVVYPDGRVFWLHDLNRLIVHGNGWNTQTIGIEIDGLFAGVEGDDSTVWDDPSTAWHEKAGSVSQAAIEATSQLIRWGTAEVAKHAGRMTKIVAHRQASMDRRNDPGSKVWKEIAIPMSAELHMDYGGVGFKLGGYAIPEAWDPNAKGIKY